MAAAAASGASSFVCSPRSRGGRSLCSPRAANRAAARGLTCRADTKSELLGLLATDKQVSARAEALVAELEASQSSRDSSRAPELPGVWRLAKTYRPKAGRARFDSLDAWRDYFFSGGPSPLQDLVLNDTPTATIYQVLELRPEEGKGRFLNVVNFTFGYLCLDAPVEAYEGGRRIVFRFDRGYFLIGKNPAKPPLELPYPVPFRLLGKKAYGWLETTYVDEDLRISRGNRGSVFVLRREDTVDPKAFLGAS